MVATGAYQRRHRPANAFSPILQQLHTDEYRNADALPEGGVLVVGSGQSGCQVAEDLRLDAISAPSEAPFEPAPSFDAAPTEIDLGREGINTIVWGSGFRLDFSWIEIDLGTVDGYPEQVQGVSRHPGLYFLGLQLLHTRKSGLVFGVGEDALHVTGVLERHLAGEPRDWRRTPAGPTRDLARCAKLQP